MLDFKDADAVFAGPTFDQEDGRRDYGETRVIRIGLLRSRMVVLVWTPRGDVRHVMSMSKANEREKTRYRGKLTTYR